MGMLKKAASGVLALVPCSRTGSTLRAPKGLRPCWTDFFDHSPRLLTSMAPRAFTCPGREIFNKPIMKRRLFGDTKRLPLRRMSLICLLSGLTLSLSASLTILGASSSRNIEIYTKPPFFSPNQLTISVGTPITWKNRTQEPHTIVSDDCRFGNQCSFDSGFLGPNARYSLPRLKPGRYPYHCGIHPFMRGLLTIHPPSSFSSSDI